MQIKFPKHILIFFLLILQSNLAAAKKLDLIEVIENKLDYSSNLQQVLNSNITKANIPNARAQTLKKFNIHKLENNNNSFVMFKTHLRHIGTNKKQKHKVINDPTENEFTPMHNNIVLTHQMDKIAKNNLEYTEMSKILRTAHGMMRAAVGGGK